MTSSKVLLNKILINLVEEWGKDDVEAALARVNQKSIGKSAAEERQFTAPYRVSGVPARLNAAQLVERASVQGERREALLAIAERFDRKQFLPSVADVREFLILTGERPGAIKDRTEAFRALLTALMKLPQDRLDILLKSTLNSGPSQLAPISDAISSAGQQLSRHRHSIGTDTAE